MSSEFEEIAEIQTADIAGRSYEQLTEQDWSKELTRLRLLVGKPAVGEINVKRILQYPETDRLNELAYQIAQQRLSCEDAR